MAPHTLIEQISPNGNIVAVVEQDDRVVYFYLHGDPEISFGMRSCWVRNLGPAPVSLDVAEMQEGIAPMLPLPYCDHPSGAGPLEASELSIVWLEEGDAAALLERDEVLAIIPSWSGSEGFAGYARDCIGINPLCWPLLGDNELLDRIDTASEYWMSWEREDNPWTQIQDAELAVYSTQLGTHEKYYAIDDGEWPPRALLRIPVSGGLALVTVGVCLRPQPLVELATDDPEQYRRIELGTGLATGSAGYFDALSANLSGWASLPWAGYTWLGPEHTILCDAFPGTEFTAVMLVRSLPGTPNVEIPSFRDDPVNLLWAIPITTAEREFAIQNGSAELTRRLIDAGVSWLWQPRRAVV